MTWPEVPLGDVLTFAGVPQRIRDPAAEVFVTVKLNCGGAVRRTIKDGKTPVPFTGYRLRAGQFIYSRIDARNGAFAIVPSGLEGAVVSKDFPVFEIRRDRVDPRYLVHYLRAGRLQYQIQASSMGATNRQRITEDRFLGFQIPLAPLGDQRRIVTILERADQLWSLRRQSVLHLEGIPQACFREMFGSHTDNPDAVLPLEAWVDRARPITYGILKPGDNVDGGIPYVRVADMRDGGIRLDGVRRTTEAIAAAYRRSQLIAGDLLISIRGHVGRCAFVPPELNGGNITQDSARLAIANPESAVYVRCALESPSLQHWMARRVKGAAVRGINLGDLKLAPIPQPPISAQVEFANSVKSALSTIAAARRELQRLEELVESIQARAFAGQL